MLQQRTVRGRLAGEGVGLHSGAPARFAIHPAPPNSGLVFVRTDLPAPVELPARAELVVGTRLATTLGRGPVTLNTVEHVLAALYGLGVDNARIEVDGPELPILDGSAQPFVDLVQRGGGTVEQRAPKRFLVVRRAVSITDGARSVRLEPAKRLELDCTIDFDHPLLTEQRFELTFSDAAFVRDIARARTFGFGRDVDEMHAAGLAKGGSLDNAVVIDDYSIRNPEGLRFPDELVRHKVLDALGDLALIGAPLVGRFTGVRSGHSLNTRLVAKLLQDPRQWEIVELQDRRAAETLALDLPAFRLGGLHLT